MRSIYFGLLLLCLVGCNQISGASDFTFDGDPKKDAGGEGTDESTDTSESTDSSDKDAGADGEPG